MASKNGISWIAQSSSATAPAIIAVAIARSGETRRRIISNSA